MKVALISCVSKKAKARCAAKDMYQSPWFFSAYAYAKKQNVDKILILSAKDHCEKKYPARHHVLEETDEIDPYNETLVGKGEKVRRPWAEGIRDELAEKVDLEYDEFIMLAGQDYREYLEGKFNFDVPKEIIGKYIGQQTSFFQSQIEIREGYFKAKDLRKGYNLVCVAARPGCYKWWATEGSLKKLFGKFELDEPKALSYIEKKEFNGEIRYCVYFGIAGRETLRKRFSQHIKGNTKGSTLRQSLASLFGRDFKDERAADEFIDELIVEYHSKDMQPSEKADKIVRDEEQKYLCENFCILNTQDNKHPLAIGTVAKLKDYRKKAKQSVQ